MELKEAAQQALEALREINSPLLVSEITRIGAAMSGLRVALSKTKDWDEIESLRASLREHMAEIHRLRAAGRQALEALENPWSAGPNGVADAIHALCAAFEPVTDFHDLEQARTVAISNLLAHFGITSANSDVNAVYLHKLLGDFITAAIGCNKEGGKLSLPLESKDLSEESLNEVVAQLKAATADRDARINFMPTHMVFTGDTLDCLKKLADERNADTGKTSDHIPDATKMMASVREHRTVGATIKDCLIVEPVGYGVFEDGNLHDSFRLEHEAKLFAALKGEHAEVGALYRSPPTSQESRQVEPVAWLQIGVGDHEGTVIATTTKPKTWNPAWWRFEPLYTAPPKREPLTDEEIMEIFISSGRCEKTFARAIERAHGIGGEE